ncbi:unnamed protein product [Symbiodinium sp. CCMP2456]|nr:unnamed protein product [Symbiodinium sp. CCMP2456]
MELRDLLGDFPHLQPLAGRWSVCRLATLSDLSTAELGSSLLRELGLASLEDCVLQEFEHRRRTWRLRGGLGQRVQSSVEWASAAAKFRRADASLPLSAGSVCLLTAWAPVVENKQKRLRQGHWPTRSHGAASLSAVDQARKAGEDKQRRRWLAQLQRLIATSVRAPSCGSWNFWSCGQGQASFHLTEACQDVGARRGMGSKRFWGQLALCRPLCGVSAGPLVDDRFQAAA